MAETAPVTIVFTDIVGAGEHQMEVGDDLALELRRRHFRLIREAVSAAGGQEVKNLGEGLMLTFPSAVAGIEAAVDIQQRVQRHNQSQAPTDLRVRIAINVGEAIRSEEDYFGTPVNVARQTSAVGCAETTRAGARSRARAGRRSSRLRPAGRPSPIRRTRIPR
jgi:class 3 adenylate cyclase